MGPTAEWREQRKESVNWETEQQKLTLSEKQRENRLKKKNKKQNRALGTCGDITEDLTFVSWESQKERGEDRLKK